MKRSYICSFLSALFLVGLNSTALCQEGVLNAAGNPDNKFTIGKDYFRVIVDGIYLHNAGGISRSIFATITVQNGDKPLDFRWAAEYQPNTVYSARGKDVVIPFIALNTKNFIRIKLERRTRQNVAQGAGLIQGLLGAAANIFTGGAASTISALTNYAVGTQKIVGEYENRTQTSDFNQDIILEDATGDTLDSLGGVLAVFTGGKGTFLCHQKTKDGSTTSIPLRIREKDVAEVGEVTSQEDKDDETPYIFYIREKPDLNSNKNIGASNSPSPPNGNIHNNQSFMAPVTFMIGGNKSSDPNHTPVYPDRVVDYVVLRFVRYTPYPSIESNPEEVASTRPHFRAIYTTLQKNPLPDNGSDDTTQDTGKKRAALLKDECDRLYEDLKKLTDAGDLSLYDAGKLMNSYGQFASTYGKQNTGFAQVYADNLAATFRVKSADAKQSSK